MTMRKKILAIIGSANKNSSNLKLVNWIERNKHANFDLLVFDRLSTLPHFDPDLSDSKPPAQIIKLRKEIVSSDGIIICTPEYVFSIPSGLKNAIEWCVSTTIFQQKPCGLITASAHGEKGHEELKLIMKTIEARFTDNTTLLIQGIKGKVDENGNIKDTKTETDLINFIESFKLLIENASQPDVLKK